MRYTISDDNLHVEDSYKVYKMCMTSFLLDVQRKHPSRELWQHRTIRSMKREWVCHNAFYKLHIARSHTKDVDLNYPQKWWAKAAYVVLFPICYLLVK